MLLDNLAKLNRPSRNALSAALVIIAAIAVYNWMVAPHTNYLFAAQQYESVIGNVAKKNKILSNTVKVKEKKLEDLREQFAQLRHTLFTLDETKELFGDLRVICEEVGCTVNSLDFVTNESGSRRRPVPLRAVAGQIEGDSYIAANNVMLSVIGVYGDIIELMEIMQKRTQGVWIDSIEMTALDGDSAKLNCDIAITIYTIQDKDTTVNE
jgi:Tfp pilus assembly protein PilO